jgi:AcrR family transcriptional regulator
MAQATALRPADEGSVPDPRDRLIAAMTQDAGAHGYASASVTRVAVAAAASRATFYQHFSSREECFLAAYRAGLDAVQSICCEAASGTSDRLLATVASLLEATSADPALARLLLIEAFAGPRSLRAEHQRLLLDAERAVLVEGSCGICLPPAALHGGLVAVISDALLGDRATSLVEMQPALASWLQSYVVPGQARCWGAGDWAGLDRSLGTGSFEPSPAAERGAEPRRPLSDRISLAPRPLLPRGRSALPSVASAADRRRRLIEASCEVIAAKGYAAATVADIVAAARVTRGAFYSHFGCKQDACLAALTLSLRESVAAVAAEFSLGGNWPERVWRGLEAFLSYVSDHPHAARLGMVEIYAAGEPARRRARENRLSFTLFLADGYRQSARAEALPALCSEAICGAIEAIVRCQLLAGRAHRSLELLPECAYVALAPFIGSRTALDFVESRLRAGVPVG